MKRKLTEREISHLLPCIKRVLETGEPWENKSLHHPVEAIVTAVLTIPGMKRGKLEDPAYGGGLDGFETNGWHWQWDWWQHFTYNGKSYTLSGSGYYGGQWLPPFRRAMRKPLDSKTIEKIKAMGDAGVPANQIALHLGISHSTAWRYSGGPERLAEREKILTRARVEARRELRSIITQTLKGWDIEKP